MKFYKNSNNEVFAYAPDGSQDHLIGDKVAITKEQADQLAMEKYTKEIDKLNYAEKRRLAYPPITDYIDGVVKGDQAQINEYIAKCRAVKAKYPKP